MASDSVKIQEKAWNTETNSEFTLNGPKGRILHMIVAAKVNTTQKLDVIHVRFF